MAKAVAVVAAIVVIAGAVYYVWPMMPAQAPAPASPAQDTSEPADEPLAQQMSGTWRSQTDAKFTREMRQDGVIIDRYEGDASAGVNGSWSIVNPAMEPALAARAAALADLSVVKASWENDSVVTYFALNSIGANTMTITDLSGRGEVTTFTRI